MPQIPAEVINDIRNKARIEDIISHYIETIKKGNNYVCVKPALPSKKNLYVIF